MRRWATPRTAVLSLAAVLFFWQLGGHDLWAPDEPYFAEGAREMVVDGEWAVPHVNGRVTTDKPPLFFWLIALASLIFGKVTPWTARLPSALAGLATVALTLRLGTRLAGPRTAALAGFDLRKAEGGDWEAAVTLAPAAHFETGDVREEVRIREVVAAVKERLGDIRPTLPVGYGDGYAKAYSPGGEALVRGRRVPVVGVVMMDCLVVDVSSVPDAGLDDEFVLLGAQGPDRISVEELARLRNTISWEVLTSMAQRLPRVYHRGPVPMAARTLLGEGVREASS